MRPSRRRIRSLIGTTNIWNVSLASNSGLLGGAYGSSDFGGSRSPDLVGMVRVDQAWGLFQASVAAHDNHAAYFGGGALAGTEPNGFPATSGVGLAALALSIKNIPTGTGDGLNVQGVYTNGASRYNFQDLMNTSYAMYGGGTGVPGVYQSLGIGGVSDAVFVNGSGMESDHDLRLPWRLHPQLGCVLEHGRLRWLGGCSLQQHGQGLHLGAMVATLCSRPVSLGVTPTSTSPLSV